MAGRDTRFTHADWAVTTVRLGQAWTGQLASAHDHVMGSLRSAQAGRTQLAEGARLQVRINEVGKRFALLEQHYSDLFRPIHEAQRRAGGVNEVAGKKTYNRRG